MNIENILQEKLINRAELARRLFPHDKNAAQRLQNKISGRASQRLTEEDKEKIKNILKNFQKDLELIL